MSSSRRVLPVLCLVLVAYSCVPLTQAATDVQRDHNEGNVKEVVLVEREVNSTNRTIPPQEAVRHGNSDLEKRELVERKQTDLSKKIDDEMKLRQYLGLLGAIETAARSYDKPVEDKLEHDLQVNILEKLNRFKRNDKDACIMGITAGAGVGGGAATGAGAGAAAGAAIGSVVPGVGTAIGAALGALFGFFGGAAVGGGVGGAVFSHVC